MKRETKINIARIILGTVGAAGVLTIAMVAPNALRIMDIFYKDRKYNRYHKRYYIKNVVTKLRDQGLIEFRRKEDKTFIALTSKGEERLSKYKLKEVEIEKPKKWDGKWRVIIFDIQERKRGTRDALRLELENLGFLRLQNSVWIHPYDCEDVVVLLKSSFSLGKEVLHMLVDRVENDKWLRKKFGLL